MDLGDDLSTRVDALMDGLVADPERLTAIPSVAFPGFLPEPVREAHDLLLEGQEEARPLAGLQEGMPLIGSGGLGELLWSGPAITVIGIDAPSVDHVASAVVPYARAEPNLRFHPEQDPREARALLVTHPESLCPFGIPLAVTPGDTGPGFEPATDGPAYRAPRTALREGWGELRSAVIAETAFPREYAQTYGDTATHARSAGGVA
ncbi:hypothetical protein ACF07L_11150 [Streptomyces anulatus]|uniref:hypothetical protein n=1 Tax=Streptomyces anulatus TaxID=1892 RepID=UPI0036F5AF7A